MNKQRRKEAALCLIGFSENEIELINELADSRKINHIALFRQSLRIYQVLDKKNMIDDLLKNDTKKISFNINNLLTDT